ncbi:MAG: LysR family transcriptional regulator [Comamonadaceae bacterium]|nr:LysR family transcriptional regulator [Comamonadaceae bacterium]
MTLTERRYIVAVARERHFGWAAEAWFVSPPTLSAAVRKLEEEPGVALFERRANDAAVTAAGEPIIALAQRVRAEAEPLRRLAAAGQDPLAAPLRLGTICTIGPYLLPYLIPALRKRAPKMPLRVEENFTAELSERLRRGEPRCHHYRAAVRGTGHPHPAAVRRTVAVALPADHPRTGKKSIKAADLPQESLLPLDSGVAA